MMKNKKSRLWKQRSHPEASRTRLGCHRGFTLVELIVVIGMFSIVMAAIYSVFVRSNRVYISQEEVVAAQQEARSALEILGREIRMAGLISTDNQPGGFDMITSAAWAANPDSAIEIATVDVANRTITLAFKSDLDDDGNTDAVRYVYYQSDHATASRRSTLYREVLTWSGGAWADPSGMGEQLFLENIQSLTLTYQMADGTTSTAPANLEDIRGVIINLVAQTAHAVEPYEGGKFVRTRQLTSNIQIRNLGLS
jgi:prepilin-type N-terminal cleavage/methylation domain-containing protein